ncbi:MAG: hypothetical protein H0U49_02645 [Parachlamydiaceae bacterium]|nr:hypothetical protein [Parachlamydiaceae bacterium]
MEDHSPLIKSTSGKSSYYRSEGTDKPSGTPAGSKNFKKILESDDEPKDGSEVVEGKNDSGGLEDDLIATGDPVKVSAHTHASVTKSPFALVTSDSRSTLSKKAPPVSPEVADKISPDVNLLLVDNSDKEDTGIFDSKFPSVSPLDPKPTVSADGKSNPTPTPAVPSETPAVRSDGSHVIKGEVKGEVKGEDKGEVKVAFKEVLNKDPAELASLQKLKATPEYSEAHLEKAREAQYTNKETSKSENISTQFNREQPDLSYVNPLGIPTQQNLITPAEVQPARPLTSANLQSLVEQLVKELSVVKTGDKTETSIVLGNPPQFNGVKIVITGYESASNEFNLRFENLSQEALLLVNQQQNRADLMSNLQQKGYNVHIFTTTTYTENNTLTAQATPNERERRDEGDGQRKRDEEEGRQK